MFGAGIARGMATTLKHFFGKKETIQYPEVRAPLSTGFRGLPRLVYDENPEDLRCVACSICANACPVHVIHIDTHRGEDRKLVLDRFDLEAGGCIFCGLCVEACPFEALTMMHGFELAAYNREQLLWTKEMLAIKATERTLADMDRIHGPTEKEEKKAAPAAPPKPPAEATAAAKAAPAANGAARDPEEAAATAKAEPVTEPASSMSEAVPGATGGEQAQAIADAEVAPPRVEVERSPNGAGGPPGPDSPPGPADSVTQPPGPVPPPKPDLN